MALSARRFRERLIDVSQDVVDMLDAIESRMKSGVTPVESCSSEESCGARRRRMMASVLASPMLARCEINCSEFDELLAASARLLIRSR